MYSTRLSFVICRGRLQSGIVMWDHRTHIVGVRACAHMMPMPGRLLCNIHFMHTVMFDVETPNALTGHYSRADANLKHGLRGGLTHRPDVSNFDHSFGDLTDICMQFYDDVVILVVLAQVDRLARAAAAVIRDWRPRRLACN